MSESGIDMERALQGIDCEVPGITWTNCADAMPPDDAKIIINVNGNYDINTGYSMRRLICVQGWAFMRYIKWTPYTPEKWKELNK